MLPSERSASIAALVSTYPDEVQHQIAMLTRKMIVFGMAASFKKLEEGPVVRTFFFEPQGDSKFSNILNKEEELAGTLHVESVRVERVLGDIAIAVPREDRQTIQFDSCLHTMLTSPLTKQMSLPLLMGTSTNGEHLYADLAAQPHLLIAGTTGSGKSVFTAQLICSLALFRTPEELEFVLVDTKKLDLVFFKTLPHVKYVLDNINDIRAGLQMLLAEVRDRNEQMSGIARNITEWNAQRNGKAFVHKVVIMDEIADVFMQDWEWLSQFKKAERPPAISDLVQQISQISRAAGIHLILATQRPSVDIIPGAIKANFPARVGFKLPTQADSRVILDANGAEKLLGKGDYLYKIAGSDAMKRAHSAFVSTNDIATILMQHEDIRRTYQHG